MEPLFRRFAAVWRFPTLARPGALGLLLFLLARGLPAETPGFQIVPNPANTYLFTILDGQVPVAKVGISGWGPNWGWTEILSTKLGTGGVLTLRSPVKLGDLTVQLTMEARLTGPRTFQVTYTLDAPAVIPLTLLAVTLADPGLKKIPVDMTGADGKVRNFSLPMIPGDWGKQVSAAVLGPDRQPEFRVTAQPAVPVTSDGELRFLLARDQLSSGTASTTLTFTFPRDVRFLGDAADLDTLAPLVPQAGWFPYTPQWTVKGQWDSKPSLIGMEGWLEAPAGKHGGLRIDGDHFQFEDGTPFQFWGVNLAYGSVAPGKAEAAYTASRFAKFGINSVRMHKFTGPGWEGIGDPDRAEVMTPDGLDRLDYFASQLAKRGIYYGWSHSFKFRVKPGDKDRLSGYGELMKNGGDTYAVINWAEDVQDLLIETVVNLLNHRNRYTGLYYRDDPALGYVELQNEDDIFFFPAAAAYDNYPTYRKQFQVRFAQWLQAKYGSQEKLAAAWAPALGPDESIRDANIAIQLNPWFMGTDNLARQSGGSRQRLLDNAGFLHDTQDRFYSKFVKAIRDTGYKGPLCGSPWQAPAMLPHYLNLKSDAQVGFIDRHDYFGGGLTDTMLHSPGGGYLSTGLQQVAGRPFSLSEWVTVAPSYYSAEGPFLVAAYGLGLQGWSGSFEFQSSSGRLAENTQGLGAWDADAPTQMGQYMALSRMVLRGDVSRGPVISVRNVGPKALTEGTFGFTDVIDQQGDIKTFSGTVPAETLAAGRALVDFSDTDQPGTQASLDRYRSGDDLVSATGQLRWDAKAGLVRVDTPGTQGFVGFAQGRTLGFGDFTAVPETSYAQVLASALDKDQVLKTAPEILVTAVARNANTGLRVVASDQKTVLDNGRAPVLLEPVRVKVTFPGRTVTEVRVLDFDGRYTRRTVEPGADGSFLLDTGRDKTLYYLFRF